MSAIVSAYGRLARDPETRTTQAGKTAAQCAASAGRHPALAALPSLR